MVLFSSLSTSQVTPLSWTQSNVTISGTSLTGSGSGNAYDALAFASIQSIPDIGYYATVNFNSSGGFAYAGLSQTMTSTDAVTQGSSKIDAGFKCDNGFVLAVYNGAEFGGLLGDTTSTYEVLYDGEKYMYFVNGGYSGVSRSAPAKNANGYRVAAAFYDSTSANIAAGTYNGSPIPQPPGEPENISVDIGIPGEMTVTWNPPSYNDGGISYYKVKYVSVDDPDTTIAETTIAVNLERSHTFTNVGANKEYIVRVIAFNNTEQSGQTASVSLTTPTWEGPSEVRNLVVTSTQQNTIDITWDSPVSTGLSSETFTKYRFYTGDNIYDFDVLVDHETGKTTGYTYSLTNAYSGTYTLRATAINGENIEGNAVFRTVQVESEPPLPVTNIAADNSVPGKLTVTWEINQTPPVASRFMVIATDSLGNQVPIFVDNTNSAELTLNAETYSIEITAITGLGGTAPSNGPAGVVVAPDSGGGGGGGGGGNNGGNGHNNMATLEFSYNGYEGSVNQTNIITVLGEEGGALTADETITVNVTPAELSEVLLYSSNWTTAGDAAGDQLRPNVKFRPKAAVGAKLTAMFNQLKALGSGAADSTGRQWTDDAGGVHPVFGNELLNLTFTNSALDDDELPREAIRSIVEGAITADDLVEDVISDLSSTAVGAPKALLEGLFEQAVSANKVSTADAINATETEYKMPTFVAGDSISFLVKYNFSKTRSYELDSNTAPGNTVTGARTTITIAGNTFDVSAGTETSDAYSKTYEIKLLAV